MKQSCPKIKHTNKNLIKIFNAAKKYKNTVGMAVQYKVVCHFFLRCLSTCHTRTKKRAAMQQSRGSAHLLLVAPRP